VGWRRLHRLVFAVAILGLLHYFWLVKVGVKGPYYYLLWIVPLFAIRIGDAVRRGRMRARRAAPDATLASRPPRPA
jgi:sulfoxide reductase heme-binding subunit YedZ